MRRGLLPVLLATGALFAGGVAGLILADGLEKTSREEGSASDRDAVSDEVGRYEALARGYHAGLTEFGDKNLSQSSALSRQDLAYKLGAPENCSLDASPVRQTRSEELQEGEVVWFLGETACQDITLPWSMVVGIPANRDPKGVLILVHGTASSPEQLFGVETGEYHPDYVNHAGLKGLVDGFVVIAPRVLTDLTYNGESGFNYLRNRVDRRAQALGMRLVGM